MDIANKTPIYLSDFSIAHNSRFESQFYGTTELRRCQAKMICVSMPIRGSVLPNRREEHPLVSGVGTIARDGDDAHWVNLRYCYVNLLRRIEANEGK